MLKRFKSFPISVRVFIITLAITLTSTLTISYFLSNQYSEMLLNTETTRIIESSTNTKNSLDSFFGQISDVGTEIITHPLVQNALTDPSEENVRRIQQEFSSYVFIKIGISNIFVLDQKRNVYSIDGKTGSEKVFCTFPSTIKRLNQGENNFIMNEKRTTTVDPLIAYATNIYAPQGNQKIGKLIIELDYYKINQMFYSSCINSTQSAFLVTTDGTILFHNPISTNYIHVVNEYLDRLNQNDQWIITKIFQTESILCSYRLERANWVVAKILPLNTLENVKISISKINLIIALAAILLCFTVSYIISYSISKPIARLNKKFQEVKDGNIDVKVKWRFNDEFGRLYASFNGMTEKLKHLMEDAVKQEKSKADMEFQVLQAQINPHFLYNTLDSIKWLANMQNAHSVCDMTNALIKFLKYNLSSSNPITSLQDELDNLEQYIIIQRFRFAESFSVNFQIDPCTLNMPVLRFMLQPIVENSLLHGFDIDIKETFKILIISSIKDNTLSIDVIDNGTGIDDHDLSIVNLSQKSNAHFSGIGLMNIHSRIQLYFGPQYGITVTNEPARGARISIHLPVD